ncbi:MAG: hypothetical protein AB9919_03075 [Geobacteraceae bacterium]
MKYSTIALFGLTVVISALAAHQRFHDSAHAMGMLKIGGGSARHPAVLDKERDSYVLIATASVVPPFRGNARVVLEGGRGLAATFHNAEPAVNFGFHRRPEFRGDTYYDLRPKDRIALWVRIRRHILPESNPGQVGESVAAGPDSSTDCPQHLTTEGLPAERRRTAGPVLAFYDTATNGRLLSIPIRFIASGGDSHGD